MSIRKLNICNQPPNDPDAIKDDPSPNCGPHDPSLRDVAGRPEMGWDDDDCKGNSISGSQANCDPMQAGRIINDPSEASPNTIYRYSKGLRGCDEAMMDLFKNIQVIDEQGKAFNVPIIWGSQERAVQTILADNVRKDNSGVIDRLRLPMLSIISSSYQFNQDRYIYHKALDYMREFSPGGNTPGFVRSEKFTRDTVFGVSRGIPLDVGYTLYAWTMYTTDMNQIFEQVVTKFSPIAYIRVRGVGWEIGVTLDSISNNLEIDPGESDRVVKFEFGFTAQTFIPQPIVRKKAVLKTRTEFLDGLSEAETTSVISRLEDTVKELQ